MSEFKLLSHSCGLSKAEAVAYLKVNEHNALSWWLGRRPCPPGVLRELRELFETIDTAADQMAKGLKQNSGEIVLSLPADDEEAKANGWPFVSVQEAVYRRVLELLPVDAAVRVRITKP